MKTNLPSETKTIYNPKWNQPLGREANLLTRQAGIGQVEVFLSKNLDSEPGRQVIFGGLRKDLAAHNV
jgi:hypothetical protein